MASKWKLKQLIFDVVRRQKSKGDIVVIDESNEVSESSLDSGKCIDNPAKSSDDESDQEIDDDSGWFAAEALHHNEVADKEGTGEFCGTDNHANSSSIWHTLQLTCNVALACE